MHLLGLVDPGRPEPRDAARAPPPRRSRAGTSTGRPCTSSPRPSTPGRATSSGSRAGTTRACGRASLATCWWGEERPTRCASASSRSRRGSAPRVDPAAPGQMHPSPEAPGLGAFVADLEAELAARGHELARAVVDRRGGRSRHLALARDVAVAARRLLDVVYGDFLASGGLLAVLGRARAGCGHCSRPGRGDASARRSSGGSPGDWPLSPRGRSRRCSDRLRAGWCAPAPSDGIDVIDCGVDLDLLHAPASRSLPARSSAGGRRHRVVPPGSLSQRETFGWRGRSSAAKARPPSSGTGRCGVCF